MTGSPVAQYIPKSGTSMNLHYLTQENNNILATATFNTKPQQKISQPYHGTQPGVHNTIPSSYYNRSTNGSYVQPNFNQPSKMQPLMDGYQRVPPPSQVNFQKNSFGSPNNNPLKGGKNSPSNDPILSRGGFSQFMPNTPTKNPYSN